MSRLSLEDFKAKTDENSQQALESLTGGILGDCHPEAARQQAIDIALWIAR